MTNEELEAKAKSLGAKFKIVVDNDGEEIVGFLKKPSRTLISATMKLGETDMLKANESLMRTCLIPDVSDMRLVDDDDIFMSALSQLSEIITIKKSTLTSL